MDSERRASLSKDEKKRRREEVSGACTGIRGGRLWLWRRRAVAEARKAEEATSRAPAAAKAREEEAARAHAEAERDVRAQPEREARAERKAREDAGEKMARALTATQALAGARQAQAKRAQALATG